MYQQRTLAPTLQQALAGFPAVLITGPRQSSKTTFLLHEASAQADYVSLDDPLERDYALQDPNGFLARFGQRALGLIVCRSETARALSGGHQALPWHQFPSWLQAKFDKPTPTPP